jgi:dihydroneopterin triphosphate diphosphatase
MRSLSRAPFQVLVIPFRCTDEGSFEYCLFLRKVENYWQGIAGGGEGNEAAVREFREESGVFNEPRRIVALDSRTSIPVVNIDGFKWGPNCLVIPENTFRIEITIGAIALSNEHKLYRWSNYDGALKMLTWDSNRSALWELNHRLTVSNQ